MLVRGRPLRTIRLDDDAVTIIDQRRLPHELVLARLTTLDAVTTAIRDMWLRGAPLIGVAAAAGMWLALRADAASAEHAAATLLASRPTAINLRWAIDEVGRALAGVAASGRADAARACAARLMEEDIAACRAIGEHGLPLLRAAHERSGRPVQVLTRCNAGWLATVDHGTALAPIYAAHDAGLPVHVWVPETRPRNQGMLTAWELGEHGVPHTILTDGAVGHLLQRGAVDLSLVGADRVTRAGDVCNKIGTYLQALAADAARVPFHVALPGSTIDWELSDGAAIPIEDRGAREVTHVVGPAGPVLIAPAGAAAFNPAFDVTPARLVTGLITERGVCAAGALASLYPERA